MRIILFILTGMLLLSSCKSSLKAIGCQEESKVRISFVPNMYTTSNRPTITYVQEYEDYGMYIEFRDNQFCEKLKSIIKSSGRSNSTPPGLRIKVVVNDNTLMLSYLTNAAILINRKEYEGSPDLLNLVASKIRKHYENGDFICEGSKCSQDVNSKNVDFLTRVIKKTNSRREK